METVSKENNTDVFRVQLWPWRANDMLNAAQRAIDRPLQPAEISKYLHK